MEHLHKDFVDYAQGGDTGEDNATAIQPVTDGEAATQTTFRRPSENLRGRFEALRDLAVEHSYYRDFNHLVIEGATGHSIAWNSGTGVITQTGALTIRPLLTPSSGTKGTLTIGIAVPDNRITYEVDGSGYATDLLNSVFIEHRDTGAAVLSVSISDGPVKRIVVFFDSVNAAHDAPAVSAAVDLALAGDADLAGLIKTSVTGAAGNTVAAQAETRIEGTADQEAHVLPSGLLTAFTGTEPLLNNGDAIGIWYRYLIEPTGGDPSDPKGGIAGGRWESNPERLTSTITSLSLFVTSSDPTKIPGAVPLCKRVNGELVWFDGSRFVNGSTGPMGMSTSVYVSPTNFAGTPTLVINGGISTLATTAQTALDSVDDVLGKMRTFTFVCTDGVSSTGGNYNGTGAIDSAISALGGLGGTIYVRRGTYTVANAFAIPSNVIIIGESRTLVTLTQGVPVSFSIGSNSVLQTLSISSSVAAITTAGIGVVLRGVRILSTTRLNFTTAGCSLSEVELASTSTTAHSFTGQSNSLTNVSSVGCINIGSNGAVLTNVVVNGGALQTVPALVMGSGSLTGGALTHANPGYSALELSGVTSVKSTAISGAFTSGVAALKLTNATATLDSCTITASTGLAIKSTGSDAVFNTCQITNNSVSALDITIDVSSTTGHLVFNACQITNSGKIQHVTLLATGVSPNIPKVELNSCTMVSGAYNVRMVDAVNSVFNNCKFFIIGNTVLSGTLSAAAGPIWKFSGGVGGLGCYVNNCTFDCGNYEVEINGVNPEFTTYPALYIDLKFSSAKNIKLLNVNQHVNFGTSNSAFVRVEGPQYFGGDPAMGYATLDGVSFVLGGVGVGGGTPRITQYVRLDQRSELTHSRFSGHPHASTGTYILFAENLCKLTDVYVECLSSATRVAPYNAVTPANWITIKDCLFGDPTTAGIFACDGPLVVTGGEWTFDNVKYYGLNDELILVSIGAAATIAGLRVHNCLMQNLASNASGAFPAVQANGKNLNRAFFSNSTFIMIEAAAAAREFIGGESGGTNIVFIHGNYFESTGSASTSSGLSTGQSFIPADSNFGMV